MESLIGMVLAAGSGSRMGRPKALVHAVGGVSWLSISVRLLQSAGCDRVLTVLGARASEVVLPVGAEAVVADDWECGMSASLRAGLVAASGSPAVVTAALITLVDLPDLPRAVAQRVVGAGFEPAVVRQAVFEGRPGHPVLLGRDHWTAAAESVHGDSGGRRYLASHGVAAVECGDLHDGHDVDR